MASQEEKQRVVEKFAAGWEDTESQEPLDVFTEDVVYEIPVLPVPFRLEGREQVHRFRRVLGDLIPAYRQAPQDIHHTTDPETIIFEATGEGPVEGGGYYQQEYIYIARLRDGKIAEVREYGNPYTLGTVVDEERIQAAFAEILS